MSILPSPLAVMMMADAAGSRAVLHHMSGICSTWSTPRSISSMLTLGSQDHSLHLSQLPRPSSSHRFDYLTQDWMLSLASCMSGLDLALRRSSAFAALCVVPNTVANTAITF